MNVIFLEKLVREVCELDVRALKPGNVSIESAAHGMTSNDFLLSAAAIAGPISAANLSIGERIFRAVEATQAVVNCNTNLGIVLLLAPIIQAALRKPSSLRDELSNQLAELNVSDAQWAYRAIRLAKPGGLGKSAHHDIAQAATVTLLEAMRVAASHDQIANLYTTNFALLFEQGMPVWHRALAKWQSQEWAASAVFLAYLANTPDSLIARKFGMATSQTVSATAQPLCQMFSQLDDPNDMRATLTAWDQELKASGLNPGTTADMTVATAFLAGLQDHR